MYVYVYINIILLDISNIYIYDITKDLHGRSLSLPSGKVAAGGGPRTGHCVPCRPETSEEHPGYDLTTLTGR